MDRRAYALELTATGRAWARAVGGALLEAEAEFLAPLSRAERRTLIGLLQRLLVR